MLGMKHKSLFKKVRLIKFCLLIILCISCSTAQMEIVSEPSGADLVFINDDGREEKLGQTPLVITSEIASKITTDSWRIGFSKMGYVKDQIFLEKKMFKQIGKVSLKLTPEANWKEAYQDMTAYKYLNDVSSMSAEVQAATVKGDYAKAESIAQALVTRYPKLSVGWNLLGNIYYLQKRVDKAVESYQKSLDINPADQVTKGILERLRGGRL